MHVPLDQRPASATAAGRRGRPPATSPRPATGSALTRPCPGSTTHPLTLTPGTTLLLFTDGLVERRDKAIDGTLRALADHCLRLVPTPPDAFCDELLTERARGSTTTPCSPCACPPRPAGEPRGRFPSDTRRRPGGAVAIHAGVSRVRNA
ncbi:SpoIIE family protein phosphatase [Streptomyces sp. NBC_00055]|uniref:SpoIIE family protein phosphatase n=1 Tax=unclassified Streptomyces TaxID=2593676 RepID=UPI0038648A92